jgi:hypothetical protein
MRRLAKYKGRATIDKYKERSRIWKFDGVICFVLQPGLDNQHVMLHDYLRQHILSENLAWQQSADAWELVLCAIKEKAS